MAEAKRQPAGGEPPDPGIRSGWRFLFVLFAWLVAAAVGVYLFTSRTAGAPEALAYSDFKEEVRSGHVARVEIRGQRLVGSSAGTDDGRRFATTLPAFDDPELLPLLAEHGVAVSFREESSMGPMLLYLLPLALVLAFFLFSGRLLRRTMGEMGGRLTGFSSSRAKRYEKTRSSVNFEDVAGLDNAKLELREIVQYLKEPARFQGVGARIPKGVLLMGPPGTGKTLLARAVAGEAEVPFFSISGSEFVELFVGVGASRVRDMFLNAKKEAPSIVFIDEIDAVGRARGTGLGGGHDEREQTLNQILAEMDGFSSDDSIVVMAATNRPDVLDAALLRPGRFDRKITLELPQRAARRKILEIHCRQVPLSEDVDLGELAAGTVGFSGADLRNLVNEAALHAARESKSRVDRADFEEARDRVMLGSRREELLTAKEQRLVSYHESGHALVALHLPGTDPLRRITIIPRGRALGATEQLPEEDRHSVSSSYLENRLAVLLGGRVAEGLVFGEVSSAAEDDLEQATQLARRMVCRWGMSERLGGVSLRQGEQDVFLGREIAQPRDFSENTGRIVDEEIQKLIKAREEAARRILEKRRDELDALAQALLERETLSAEEVESVLKERTSKDPPRPRGLSATSG